MLPVYYAQVPIRGRRPVRYFEWDGEYAAEMDKDKWDLMRSVQEANLADLRDRRKLAMVRFVEQEIGA